MGFRIGGIIRQSSFSAAKATRKGLEVPKGYLAVYVGDKMRRFVIPVSNLYFKNYYVKLKKNSDMIIRKVVSQFHVKRMSF